MNTILYNCGVTYILRNLIYIYIYLHFPSFLKTDMSQAAEIFPSDPRIFRLQYQKGGKWKQNMFKYFHTHDFSLTLTCLSREYKRPNFLVSSDITAPSGVRPSTGRCRWLRWPRYHRLSFHLLTHGDLNSMTDILQTKVSIALILCFQRTSDATYNCANKGRERLTVIHSQGASWTLTLIPLWISNYIYKKNAGWN